MQLFQKSKEETEQKMILKLMTRIEGNPTVSQRTLASELGIALGLMNAYLKRCIKKGWIRASQVPAKRFAYYLTPEGFKEKSRMVMCYLTYSLAFFRDAHFQCKEALATCVQQGWKKVSFVGEGDLADIAFLVSYKLGVEAQLSAVDADFSAYDAVLITDIQNPQNIYDVLKGKIDHPRLFVLDLLHVSKHDLVEGNYL
jgi:hypothetical protein